MLRLSTLSQRSVVTAASHCRAFSTAVTSSVISPTSRFFAPSPIFNSYSSHAASTSSAVTSVVQPIVQRSTDSTFTSLMPYIVGTSFAAQSSFNNTAATAASSSSTSIISSIITSLSSSSTCSITHHSDSFSLESTKRKRVSKMNKHKWKKRLKLQRRKSRKDLAQ